MKTILLTALLLLPIAFVACKTTPTTDQLQRTQDITRAAVQSACTLQLTALPAQRPYLQASLTAVNEAISQGKVTATVLGRLITALPLDPNVVRYTQTGLLIYDTLSVLWMNPATDAALLATARGISEGLANALSLTANPQPVAAPRSALRAPRSVPPPAPVWTGPGTNVKRI